MTGKYELEFKARNNTILYKFVLDRQVTILKGESGTGKTTLFNIVRDLFLGEREASVSCNMSDKLELLTPNRWKAQMLESHNKIIFADEFQSSVFNTLEFAQAIAYSDNYYVIISRSGRLNYLTYSVDSIYEVSSQKISGSYIHSFQQRYVNRSQLINPNLVIVEDSGSGYEMYKSLLTCDVQSANGKENICKLVDSSIKSGKTVFVIADGAAFGSNITALFPTYSGKDLYVFTPESFEWLLLKYDGFRRFLGAEFSEPWNYCDTKKYISYEPYFTDMLKKLCLNLHMNYSKSRLDKGFKTDKVEKHIQSCLTDLDRSCFRG